MLYVPYPSFVQSAACLSDEKLGEQLVEFYRVCSGRTVPPEWKGSRFWLCTYWHTCIVEWLARGYEDDTHDCFLFTDMFLEESKYPMWLGDETIHSTHRTMLGITDEVCIYNHGHTSLHEQGRRSSRRR